MGGMSVVDLGSELNILLVERICGEFVSDGGHIFWAFSYISPD